MSALAPIAESAPPIQPRPDAPAPPEASVGRARKALFGT